MKSDSRAGLRLGASVLTLVLMAAGAGAGPGLQAQSPAEQQESFRPPRGAMIAPGPSADLTLLYTGDVIGYLDPCG